jgi:cyclopropane fatty-acyl-phospholipid synthase-like methyltransferase
VTVDLQTRIDAAVACNVAPDEYFSLWDELGLWQLEALKKTGLLPHHKLLDFGCGAFRLGLFAIDYLDDGNYYGIDAFEPYVEIGRRLVVAGGITKQYHAMASRDFAFDRFETVFDFGIAQSVFTHMSGDECERCMAVLKKTMKPGGTFLFTFLIGAPLTRGMMYAGIQAMQRFAMNDPDFFAALASRHGATFERSDIPHPTAQQVAVFRF